MSTIFTQAQLEEINLGEKNGLTKKQVETYAKRIFNAEQMKEIRLGYEHKLTDKQIGTYAKSNFRNNQMKQIRLGYQKKLTDKQVELYAKVDIHDWVMRAVRLELQDGLTFEQEKEFLGYEFNVYANWISEKNIRLLIKCIRKRIERRDLKRIIKMCESLGSWTDTRIFLNNDKLALALEGFLRGFTLKEVKLCADPKFSVKQSKEISLGLRTSLSIEQVKIYADEAISPSRMKKIREVLLKAKYEIS